MQSKNARRKARRYGEPARQGVGGLGERRIEAELRDGGGVVRIAGYRQTIAAELRIVRGRMVLRGGRQ